MASGNKDATEKEFDCVQFMRDARARIDAETAGMTDEERLEWYRSREYTDPWLAQMAQRIRDQSSGSKAKP